MSAHYRAREIGELGHEVRLIPLAYAKAYDRRNKNDLADAEAICEAVNRPAMRFLAVKTEAQQAAAGVHEVRAILVKQDTMLINTSRRLMAEFGIVVAEGLHHVDELAAILADPADRCMGGKVKLGPISKRGNGYLRRLLANGGMRCRCGAASEPKQTPGWSNCSRPRSARSLRSPTRWRGSAGR